MGIEKYDELARLVGEARARFEEFVNGKKIAATRCRLVLQEIKQVSQDARVEIQQRRKSPGGAPETPPPGEQPPQES